MTGTATVSKRQTDVTHSSSPGTGRFQINSSIFLGMTCLGGAIVLLASKPALTSETVAIQSPPTTSPLNLQPDPTPLNLAALESDNPAKTVYTSTSFVNDSMVMPSLWWMRDQFSAQEEFGEHLIKNWLLQPIQDQQPGRVDLVVDQQTWNQLDYLHRYEFITGFGTDAHRYGYNLRVFDQRGRSLGASTCDFGQVVFALAQSKSKWAEIQTATTDVPSRGERVEEAFFPLDLGQLTCRVALDASGKGMLRGKP